MHQTSTGSRARLNGFPSSRELSSWIFELGQRISLVGIGITVDDIEGLENKKKKKRRKKRCFAHSVVIHSVVQQERCFVDDLLILFVCLGWGWG